MALLLPREGFPRGILPALGAKASGKLLVAIRTNAKRIVINGFDAPLALTTVKAQSKCLEFASPSVLFDAFFLILLFRLFHAAKIRKIPREHKMSLGISYCDYRRRCHRKQDRPLFGQFDVNTGALGIRLAQCVPESALGQATVEPIIFIAYPIKSLVV